MTTHILNFGYTTGQSLTAQLFAIGSDTIAATASSVTEATNRKGRYAATFSDLDAGDYLLIYSIGGTAAGSEYFTVAGTDGESLLPWSERYAPVDMRLLNGQPPQPLGYMPAKEESVQQAITAINGIDPGGGSGSPTGPGGIPVVIPITVSGQPVDGVAVWITTDPEGTNQIAGVIHTDTFGNTNPPFTLEPGIFYVWVQKAGINFNNPQAIQVLENGTYQWYTG